MNAPIDIYQYWSHACFHALSILSEPTAPTESTSTEYYIQDKLLLLLASKIPSRCSSDLSLNRPRHICRLYQVFPVAFPQQNICSPSGLFVNIAIAPWNIHCLFSLYDDPDEKPTWQSAGVDASRKCCTSGHRNIRQHVTSTHCGTNLGMRADTVNTS